MYSLSRRLRLRRSAGLPVSYVDLATTVKPPQPVSPKYHFCLQERKVGINEDISANPDHRALN